MTRLLFPEAFGLVTAAVSLIVGIALISDVGIRAVIMRSPQGESDSFLCFAWTLQVIRGSLLWIALTIFCCILSTQPIRHLLPAESVFANEQFPWITAVLGIALVLSGLESTAVHLNSRRLNLRPVIFIEVLSRIVSLPIMIAAAWILQTVWAIVIGNVMMGLVRLLLTHFSVPGPRMHVCWDPRHLGEFFHFGKWISIASAATFISGQADRLFIGIVLSGSSLGIYSVAKLSIESLTGLFERMNSSLAVPVLGEVIRVDRKQLSEKYYRFRLPFDLSAPLVAGIFCSAGSAIIRIFYDSRYFDAGYILQILAFGLCIFPPSMILSAFPLVGRPQVAAAVSTIQATALLACMTFGFNAAGLIGIVYGIAVHRIAPTAVVLILAYRRGWVDLKKETRIIPIFGLGILLGMCVKYVAEHLGLSQI